MTAHPLVSVVLPCRNQADHLAHIVPRYATAFDHAGMSAELILVPNASTDATEYQAHVLAAADSRVRCVANSSGGWGRSVRIGLEATRGQVLVYTNSARTDPDSLPEFVRRHLDQPQSLVKAARRQRNALLREVGSTLYNLEARVLFGVRCHDVNGTPKVFSRMLYDQMSLTQDGDLIDLELIAQATRLRASIVDIPTFGFKRHGGKSSTTLRSAWRMYAGALGLRLKPPGLAVRAVSGSCP